MKKFLSILAGVICVALAVTPFFLTQKNIDAKTDKSVILTVWHIDTFEGGRGSRYNFLREQAVNFAKANEGVYLLVSNHTPLSVEKLLEKGSVPDLLSYGFCGIDLSGFAKELKGYEYDGGVINDKQFAVSYLKGGYFVIKKGDGKDKLILSKGEYNATEIACLFSNERSENLVVKSPLDAYSYFLTQKNATLIGTQRDINRLVSRNAEFTATPIDEFSDLFQYFSLTSKDKNKEFFANKFIAYMLSDKVQSKLTNLGMLSVNKQDLYGSGDVMHDLERTKINYTVSPFSSVTNFQNASNETFSLIKQGESKHKITNFLKQL